VVIAYFCDLASIAIASMHMRVVIVKLDSEQLRQTE